MNNNGRFTDSGQPLGDGLQTTVSLGDVDGDGDLDLITGNSENIQIYLNDY